MRGWGCNCRSLNISAGGPWKQNEANYHINVLELQAVYLALQALCKDKLYISIHLLIDDNTTAVAYVREQGGSRFLECNKMTRKIRM